MAVEYGIAVVGNPVARLYVPAFVGYRHVDRLMSVSEYEIIDILVFEFSFAESCNGFFFFFRHGRGFDASGRFYPGVSRPAMGKADTDIRMDESETFLQKTVVEDLF